MPVSNALGAASHQTNAPKSYNNYTDIGALNDLKREAREDQKSALRPVAQQFEALFVEQILKEARKVSFDDGWLDGEGGDVYKDWYDKQLAQDLSAKGTLGFADNLVEQLAPRDPKELQALNALKQKSATTEQALALRNLK